MIESWVKARIRIRVHMGGGWISRDQGWGHVYDWGSGSKLSIGVDQGQGPDRDSGQGRGWVLM